MTKVSQLLYHDNCELPHFYQEMYEEIEILNPADVPAYTYNFSCELFYHLYKINENFTSIYEKVTS